MNAAQPRGRAFLAVLSTLTAATGVAAGLAAFNSDQTSPHWSSGMKAPLTLVLNAAAQHQELVLTWGPISGAAFVVRWRAAGESSWQSLSVGSRSRHTIKPLTNGILYELGIEAWRDEVLVGRSGVIRTKPRERQGCATTDYMPGAPPTSFFCSKPTLDQYLASRNIDPLSLRCRQQPVTEWSGDTPDCRFVTPAGEHLLMLRGADESFPAGTGFPSAALVRRQAREAVWGDVEPVDAPPRPVEFRSLESPLVGRVTGHADARSFVVRIPGGLPSTVTWFAPRRPIARRIAIYHEGHGGTGTEIGSDTIDWLLRRGWPVVAIDMPLIGANAGTGGPHLRSHGDLEALDDGKVSPIQHFLRPVKAVVDIITRRARGFDPEILLIGRSGGGWTSYVYGAMDPRIDVVVSVAGGRPISARLDAPWGAAELGDYEQTVPHLYNATGHEHLMLAAGTRGAFYIFNRWDSCCFRVQPDDPFVEYLRAGGRAAGKPIGVFVDERHSSHSMSLRAFAELDVFLIRLFGSPISCGNPRRCLEFEHSQTRRPGSSCDDSQPQTNARTLEMADPGVIGPRILTPPDAPCEDSHGS